MEKKKYQIFISSPYKDLKVQRTKAIQAILNMGHLPSGMELFVAANEEQFEYIKRAIDDSDYYVLILGKCYGTISPATKKSYTEMEYEYAISKNKPILAFLSDEDINLNFQDKNIENIKKLRNMVLNANRLVKFWKSDEDLIECIIISLNNAFANNPQSGWVKKELNSTMDNELIFSTAHDYIIDFYPQVDPKLNVRNNAWYEKYKSGRIRQGGNLYLNFKDIFVERYLTLMTPFKTNDYSFFYNIINSDDNSLFEISIKEKNTTSIKFKINNLRNAKNQICLCWEANGF